MINLIPPKEKEKLSIERVKRMIIIFWFLVFFFILCLVLILLAVRIYAKSQFAVQQSYAASIKKEFKKESIEEVKSKVQFINSNLDKMNSFYENKFYFSSLIEKISQTLPENLYLNEFSIISLKKNSTEDEYVLKISLAGFSPSRDDLLEFKGNLESRKEFVSVTFPASNWVEKINIDFSVSFEIAI